MTMTQTVEITADRRTIDVPREIPSGATIITFTPIAGKDVNPSRKSISQYFGILSPDTYGDGVAYQRKLRDEWND